MRVIGLLPRTVIRVPSVGGGGVRAGMHRDTHARCGERSLQRKRQYQQDQEPTARHGGLGYHIICASLRPTRAIANGHPLDSPYSRAARAVLEQAGLWAVIPSKLLMVEDASETTALVAHGSSQAGIVPLSLAKAPEMAKLGTFALIPLDSHREEPLKQRMVLLKNAGDTATAFYRYVQGPAARAVLSRYGFVLPGE
jgi:ABC-type molybdate transport system substrate-binding protein